MEKSHERPFDHSCVWHPSFASAVSPGARYDPSKSASDAPGLSQGYSSCGATKTPAEQRQTRSWGIILLLLVLAFPLAAGLSAKAAQHGFLGIFLSAFGVPLLFNIVDWLILDWLIFCTFTPRFAVLPGTEGMAGYKNYAMHFRGFLIGTIYSAGVGVVIAVMVTFV